MPRFPIAKAVIDTGSKTEEVTVLFQPRHEGDIFPWLMLGTDMRWRHSEVEEIHYSSEFKLGTDSVRTGNGTALELAVAATVAIVVARYFSEPRDSFFVAGHEHENLRKGASSIAWEGGVEDWPWRWMQTTQAEDLEKELGVHFEALSGWGLAIFPEEY